ncbi:MAG: hypothetical protein ACHQNA_07285, partial [Acidimicrobiales bacterium]
GFEAVLARRGAEVLAVAIGVSALSGLLSLNGTIAALDAHPQYSPLYLGYQAVRSLNTWCWVVSFLCIGIRVLSGSNPLSSWGVEMPLPFYVLNHPVLVVVARYVVAWSAGLWVKFAIVTVLSIGITLVLCEAVQRNSLMRMIFGLRPRKTDGPRPPALAAARPSRQA